MTPSRVDEIRVRSFHLQLPAEVDAMLVKGEPELSCLAVALSYLFAELEPYLIRTMRTAAPQVASERLREDMRRFSAQEAQHARGHARFNKALNLPHSPPLAALRAQLGVDYRRFAGERGMPFNLAYAESFEAFTTAMALFLLEIGWIEQVDPAVRELFEWHLVEELEHRTVAFDAYQALGKGYVFRLKAGAFAQLHFGRFVFRATRLVHADQRERLAAEAGAARLARNARFLRDALLGFWPKLVRTYTPWYTPRALKIPERVRLRGEYYAACESVT
ncbi:MAG: metal-dependent hydrolase [Myxococcales bacterium]